MATIEEIFQYMLDPMRATMAKPSGVGDAIEALDHYARVLEHFDVEDIQDGWAIFMRDNKRQSWPSANILMNCCRQARGRRLSDQLVEETRLARETRLHREANEIVANPILNEGWLEKGIIGAVWRFYQDHERLPNPTEERVLDETHMKASEWIDVQGSPQWERALRDVHKHELERIARVRAGGPYIPLEGDPFMADLARAS